MIPFKTRFALLPAIALAVAWSGVARDAAADPTKDVCIAANESAQVMRKEGKLIASQEQLRVCISASCPPAIRDDCTQRLDEMNRLVPDIVFDVKDAAGHDVSDVKVTVDGRPLADHLDGSALAVDPGDHSFTFERAGQPPVTQVFVIHEGERARRERVVLTSAPAGPAAPAPAAGPSAPLPDAPRPSSWSTNKTLALVSAGVGVVGVGVGAVLGLSAIDKNGQSNADGHCDSRGCDPTGKALRNDALGAASASTVAFTIGAVGLVGGVVLWFTAPSKSSIALAPRVDNHGTQLTLTGAF